MIQTIWFVVFAVLELPKDLSEMFDPMRGTFIPRPQLFSVPIYPQKRDNLFDSLPFGLFCGCGFVRCLWSLVAADPLLRVVRLS